MKKIIVLAVFVLAISTISYGQFRVGLKFGASSNNFSTSAINITSQSDINDLKLALVKANYGVHAGLFTQLKIAGFFIQPEIMFNSTSSDYKLSQLGGAPLDVIKRESYQNVDIPVLLGVSMGPLQLGVGPVGHYFLKSTSELFEVQGYSQKFKELKYGYQANAALVIGKLYIDVRYEGNLSKYGDHFIFYGHQYAFDKAPSRIIGSIGLAF